MAPPDSATTIASEPVATATDTVTPSSLPPTGWRRGTFAAFQYGSFTHLWLGTLSSSGGMWIQQIAVNWLVYDLTRSAAVLAWVQAFRTAPWALTAPFQGVLIDRLDRRSVIMTSQAFLVVASLIFAFD